MSDEIPGVNAGWGSAAGRRQLTRGKDSDRKLGCCRVLRRRAPGSALCRIVLRLCRTNRCVPIATGFATKSYGDTGPPSQQHEMVPSKAVTLVLADAEGGQGSHREIARRRQVSHEFVHKDRRSASGDVARCARESSARPPPAP